MTSILKTVKVPRPLATALRRLAKERGRSESELIRQGIESVLAGSAGLDMRRLIGADIGIGHGPRDLSSNRRRLVGYGRSRHR